MQKLKQLMLINQDLLDNLQEARRESTLINQTVSQINQCDPCTNHSL